MTGYDVITMVTMYIWLAQVGIMKAITEADRI